MMFTFFLAPAQAKEETFNYEKEAVFVIKSSESDEFINYWQNDFRKREDGTIIPICDISKDDFTMMYYSHYSPLSEQDKKIVNATNDFEEGYTIKDSINQLAAMYANHNNDNGKSNLDQSTGIIVVVSIAIFGVSTISIFFIFKQKKFIK